MSRDPSSPDKAPSSSINPQSASTTDAGQQPSASHPAKVSSVTVVLMTGMGLAGVLAILYAWQLWPFTSSTVSTENAYVRGQVTVLAPQVNGYVVDVPVRDFEDVVQGQVLLRIDARIYEQKVENAAAALSARQFDLENNAQTLASDKATLQSRRAELDSAQAEEARAKADELRVNALVTDGSVSLRERDENRATARTARAKVKQAQAAIAIAEEQVKSTRVSLGGLQADVKTAQANLRLAQIDLDNTVIRAPRTGRLSEVSVRLGQYLSAGSQLMYLVPEKIWVVANYKETQTENMRLGQPVSFDVDALGGVQLTGTVEAFAPATGSEFSLLRADNATGNFTKVVQRIPVRIAIDSGQAMNARLVPGMSVIAHVDTAGQVNEKYSIGTR
jgi:multidrug resistance efflux pump